MRPRKHNRDLPPRVYRKHGAYWHVRAGKWTRLSDGDDKAGMLARYAQIESGDDPQSLSAAIDRYTLETLPNLSPRTQSDYKRALLMLKGWAGHFPMQAIQARHVVELLNLHPSPTEGNRLTSVLSSVFKRAIRWGWVDYNPCLGLPRNPNPRRDYVPSWSEIAELRASVPDHTAAAIDLALSTALRLGDMLALKSTDVTGRVLTAHTSKTGQTVRVSVTDGLERILERLQAGRESLWIVPNSKGERYSVSGWESLWQRQKIKAGFQHVRWHDLRARALTDTARLHGRDYAQALAAHADGSTTERYIRARGEVALAPVQLPF